MTQTHAAVGRKLVASKLYLLCMCPQKCGVVWLVLVLEGIRRPMFLAASLRVVVCHRRFGMHDGL